MRFDKVKRIQYVIVNCSLIHKSSTRFHSYFHSRVFLLFCFSFFYHFVFLVSLWYIKRKLVLWYSNSNALSSIQADLLHAFVRFNTNVLYFTMCYNHVTAMLLQITYASWNAPIRGYIQYYLFVYAGYLRTIIFSLNYSCYEHRMFFGGENMRSSLH